MKQELADLIERYAHGGEKISLAIRGLTSEDMQTVPPPEPKLGKWTIQQVVIHLLDSDLISTDRIKRMIAEDNPTLVGYDENKFAEKLFYNEQSTEDAVTIISLNRKMFAGVLKKLPDSAFDRPGTHSERGKVTIGTSLKLYTDHLEHHLSFIHAKRAAMGKEMW
ncbi:MAG: DinB family protein [Anaerolineae bacterium]|nr:DinB family protein [Phycisphaerae bacterium]